MKLKIGVFFDGTGYNAYNTLHTNAKKCDDSLHVNCNAPLTTNKKQALFLEQVNNYCHIPANYFLSKSSSYKNSTSNIWHLYNLYEKGRIKTGYQLAIYVSGCGTTDGEDDDLFTMATGWSLSLSPNPSGVIDKTDFALSLIEEQLQLLTFHEAISFDTIEFELFGFSRGASSARHLANRIDQKDYVILKLFRKFFNELSYRNIEKDPCGKISFIGLYDSVAAILDLTDLDINSAKTGRANIELKKNIADNIFHITAAHEIRFNFSLNRVLPENYSELELPGCHIDIGGGSRCNLDECFFISKPFYFIASPMTSRFKSRAYKSANKELQRLLQHPRWGDIIKAAKIEIISWKKNSFWPYKTWGSAVLMKRKKIKKGIDLVALSSMVNYATSKGCSFNQPTDNRFAIPDDLAKLYKASVDAIQILTKQSQVISLANNLPAKIAQRYIHCSFFWSSIPKSKAKLKKQYLPNTAFFNLLLVNRPTDSLVRTEFDSFGKPLTKAAENNTVWSNFIKMIKTIFTKRNNSARY